MNFQLIVVQGRSSTPAVRLADGVTTIGRQEGCDLRVSSSLVSRKHCQLFEKNGYLLVKDLGSSNGTFVNGKRVAEQQILQHGDELTVGQIRFRIEKLAESAKPAAKPGDTAVGPTPVAVGAEDSFEIALIDDETVVKPESSPTVPAAAAVAAAQKTDPPSGEKKAMADDAVADFLLSIDVDEEDK